MDYLRKSSILICGALVFATAGAPARLEAGVIRHDQPDASYINLSGQFPSVGVLKTNNAIKGSGVLIDPEWVLTAAHFSLGSGDRTFTVEGHTRGVAELIRHPNWVNPNIHEGFDLSLIKLDNPIFDVTPAILPEAPIPVLGRTMTFTGYGETGNGQSGRIEGSAGTRRAGTNKIDGAGGSPTALTYSNNIVWADFDGDGLNQIGSSSQQPLEYLVARFDSGGGVFVEDGGEQVLAAINSTVLLFNADGGGGQYEYGDQMGATLVGPSLSWITDTALPKTLLGDADNDRLVTGVDLIVVQQNFGKVGAANGLLLGDANDNGKVTGLDLVTVQENFGNALGGTGPVVAAIPEPATLISFVLMAIGAARR